MAHYTYNPSPALNTALSSLQGSIAFTLSAAPYLQSLDFMFFPTSLTISTPSQHNSSPLQITPLNMPEEFDQPNPATIIAGLEVGFKALNIERKTPDTEDNIAFLARAMAHISSLSFVPPVLIEGLESVPL